MIQPLEKDTVAIIPEFGIILRYGKRGHKLSKNFSATYAHVRSSLELSLCKVRGTTGRGVRVTVQRCLSQLQTGDADDDRGISALSGADIASRTRREPLLVTDGQRKKVK